MQYHKTKINWTPNENEMFENQKPWRFTTHYNILYTRRVAPSTPTRSCVHIGVLKKNKEQKK